MAPSCAKCTKTTTASGSPLKCCAKCKKTKYCSRECQMAHWKVHKKDCASNVTPPETTTKSLSVTIEKPFHHLHAKTWIHGRPEQDVYKLLIDTFRFRQEDNYKLMQDVDDDSLYSGAPNSLEGFLRFLRLAEKRSALLPSWWSQEKAKECEALGMSKGWSSLAAKVEKGDLIEHYGDDLIPMQLRMFGEQVYGTGPAGMSGADMIRAQMMVENQQMYSTRIDIS